MFDEKFIPPFIIGKGQCFKDERGSFTPLPALKGTKQCNVSVSKPNTVRGMHWQKHNPQAKLVSCLAGKIHDVCVDMRPDSSTFMKIYEFELEGGSGEQLFVPVGFAHGFEVCGEKSAMVLYMVSEDYFKNDEHGFLWNSIGCWRTDEKNAIVSEKDGMLPSINDYVPGGQLFEDLPKI